MWFFGVYRVHDIIKEEFVANAVQVEMQCRHLYTICHAKKVANVTTTYQTKHEIVDNDMV